MTRVPARLAGWVAICALLGLALLDSRAASISFAKLNVHVDALPASGTAYNVYTPHRFTINNSSNKMTSNEFPSHNFVKSSNEFQSSNEFEIVKRILDVK